MYLSFLYFLSYNFAWSTFLCPSPSLFLSLSASLLNLLSDLTTCNLAQYKIIFNIDICSNLSRQGSYESNLNRKEENERISVQFDKPKTTFDSINSNLKATYEQLSIPVSNVNRSSRDRNTRSSMEYGLPDDVENGESDDDEFGRSGVPDEDVLGTGGWGTIESQAFRCVEK